MGKSRVATIILFGGFLVISSAGLNQARAEVSEEMQVARRQELAQKANQALESKEWIVGLTTTTKQGKRIVSGNDVFTFREGKIKSSNLSAQGFNESNFTLTVNDDGVAIIETMQVRNTKDGRDLTFIRAELNGNVLGGVISIRPQKVQRTIYTFSSQMP